MGKLIWACNNGPQTSFLASTVREVLYGGAVGGGKTDALLACDLRWADNPLHRSIYLRRTRPQLQEAIDRSQILYPEIVPGANWLESKSRWEMPSGAIFQMGYAEHEQDILNFKSFEYNVVKFDELTSFTEYQYKFMFLRNRSKSKDLPLWVRSGTNPGDVGHEFVYNRFIKEKEPYKVYLNEIQTPERTLVVSQQFIPSFIWDNPSLPNKDDYIAGIMQMSEEDIAAFLYGQWTALAGAMFKVMPVELPTRQLAKKDHFTIRCMDYGWSDHTAIYWLVVYDNGALIDIVGEIYVNQTPIEGIAQLVKGMEEDLSKFGVNKPSISIGSPEMGKTEGTSGQTLSTMFALHGAWVEPSKGAAGSRKTGWSQLQRLLHSKRLRSWPGACPNLLRTLPILSRNPKDPDDLKDHQEDHAADALRYGVMSIIDPVKPIAIEKPKIDSSLFDTRFDKVMDNLRKGQRRTGLGQFF